MNVEKLKGIIDQFNEGGWDKLSPHFNDNIELFLDIVERQGLIELIDPLNTNDFENLVFYKLLETNPKYWTHFIAEKVINSDVTIRDGKYFLHLYKLEDLSDLFYQGRNENTSSLVFNYFTDDWWEPFDYTTDDVYRDVIEELTNKNLILVRNYMLKELDGESVYPNTEVLKEFENEEGQVNITIENFDRFFEDEETCKYLLKEYADETRQELYSIHSNAYNTAFQDEISEKIWGELDTFFVGRPLDFSQPIKGSDKKKYWFEIEIRNLTGDLKHFLYEYKNSSHHYTLSYNGTYMGMLQEGMSDNVWDRLDFRIPDGPDFRLVDKYINDGVKEYM